MSIEEFNQLSASALKNILHQCCGSSGWVSKMSVLLPFKNVKHLLDESVNTWHTCEKKDWLEAFSHHPKIGDLNSLKEKFKDTAHLTSLEQSGVEQADEVTLRELQEGNKKYEEKFGFIFIVFATGKTAAQMLQLLNSRLDNTKEAEIFNAMEEQGKITNHRLEQLFDK